MQKDEEVGKVAQATPIVISKALELFLALIIDEASKVTIERGSKKVEAYHLKHAVDTTETLDFLKEIVQAVPDPSAGGTIDLDADNQEGGKKKRSRAKRSNTVSGAPEGSTTKKRRKKKGDVEAEPEPAADNDGEEPEPDQDGDAPMRDEDDDD